MARRDNQDELEKKYVEGVFRGDQKAARDLYNYCKRYFDENYRGVFFAENENRDEIFQEAFITLWEKIANRKYM